MNGYEKNLKRDGGEAVYLFCIARFGCLPTIEGRGIDGGHPVSLWTFRDIAAVFSMVSVEEFLGPSAESRMRDLAWIGPRARRHEEVIEQGMNHSPVLPARFGTLFSSMESLSKVLGKRYDTISSFLDRIDGKEEWAVKVLMDRAKAKDKLFSTMLAREERRLVLLSPGVRYFQEQRIRASVEKELASWLKETGKKIAANLNRHASYFCERKALPRGILGNDLDMVMNWAFLAPRSSVLDFRVLIDQANADYARRGLIFKCSGPWPPYSFCPSLELEKEE